MNQRTKLKVGRPSKSIKEKLIDNLYDEEPMSQISLRLSSKLHAKLKIYATNKGMSIKSLMTKTIEEMVNIKND